MHRHMSLGFPAQRKGQRTSIPRRELTFPAPPRGGGMADGGSYPFDGA